MNTYGPVVVKPRTTCRICCDASKSYCVEFSGLRLCMACVLRFPIFKRRFEALVSDRIERICRHG